MNIRGIILTLLTAIGAVFSGSAQVADPVMDSLAFVWHSHTVHTAPEVYLHLDKSLYAPNENVLFTSYLIGGEKDTTDRHTLYIFMMNLATRKIIVSDRFIMRQGLSSGALLVPDTTGSGDYLIVAYTNALLRGKNEHYFRQQVRISSGKRPPFALRVSEMKAGPGRNDSIRMTCKITTDYSGVASGGIFDYNIYADGSLSGSGSKTIDAFGEIHIGLCSKDTLAHSVTLSVHIDRKGSKGDIWMPLILRPDQVMVRCYPEGGTLVDGCRARVGVEIRQPDGRGIATRTIVTEDGREIVRCHTDEYGFGIFEAVFHKGCSYAIQCMDLPEASYTCGQFPVIHPFGYTLHIPHAVTRDSLDLELIGPADTSKGILMICSAHEILYTARLTWTAGHGKLRLPVQGWPAGIATAFLFTEDGAPAAERPICIRAAGISVDIRLDSSVYHGRSKIQLHILLKDESGRPMPGIFSLAAALSSRVGRSNLSDIARVVNFDHLLPSPDAVLPPSDYFDSDTTIELLLLTRYGMAWERQGNRQYPRPAILSEALAEDFGYVVSADGRKVRKPVPLALISPSLYSFNTDSSGHFVIPYPLIVGPSDTRPLLTVSDKKSQDRYKIVLLNSYDTVNKQLAAIWYSPQVLTKDTSIHHEQENNGVFNSVKTLTAVVVRSGGENEVIGPGGPCDDFICIYDHLNCRGAPYGGRPVIGRTYLYRHDGISEHIVYKGCLNAPVPPLFAAQLKPIRLAEDLYAGDSSKLSSPEPVTLSTLYWSPLQSTDQHGEATLSFYTGDLAGRFYVIVQGISAAGAFTGRQYFRVGL